MIQLNAVKAVDEMQAYYAARAPYYDAVYLKPERAADIAFLAAYLPQRLAGRQVLEVACGTGYWTRHFAAQAKQVVATDATPEPLAFARLRPGTQGVAFRQADAYALPDDLGNFDGAFAGMWFSHVPLALRAPFLDGLHARLSAGARVILIDNNEAQLRDFPIMETDAAGDTWQHRRLRDGALHRVLKHFPDEATLRQCVGPVAAELRYQQLDNFWLLDYTLA